MKIELTAYIDVEVADGVLGEADLKKLANKPQNEFDRYYPTIERLHDISDAIVDYEAWWGDNKFTDE